MFGGMDAAVTNALGEVFGKQTNGLPKNFKLKNGTDAVFQHSFLIALC
jgi:hypothetical protein